MFTVFGYSIRNKAEEAELQAAIKEAVRVLANKVMDELDALMPKPVTPPVVTMDVPVIPKPKRKRRWHKRKGEVKK